MNPRTIETGVRAVAVALVTAVGLFASTPNVHGTADTRGGVACDVNRTLNTTCKETTYGAACLYAYTTCSSVSGWRFMTCLEKPASSNQCNKDQIRCLPHVDYMTSGNCTPTYLAPKTAAASSPLAARVSQTQ